MIAARMHMHAWVVCLYVRMYVCLYVRMYLYGLVQVLRQKEIKVTNFPRRVEWEFQYVDRMLTEKPKNFVSYVAKWEREGWVG